MLLLGSVLLIIYVGFHGFKAYQLQRKQLILPISLGLIGLGAFNSFVGIGIIWAGFGFGVLICGMGITSIVVGIILNDIGTSEKGILMEDYAIRIGAGVFIIGSLLVAG